MTTSASEEAHEILIQTVAELDRHIKLIALEVNAWVRTPFCRNVLLDDLATLSALVHTQDRIVTRWAPR